MFGENRSSSVEARRREDNARKQADLQNRADLARRYAANKAKVDSRNNTNAVQKYVPPYRSQNIQSGRDSVYYEPSSGGKPVYPPLQLRKKKSTASRIYARITTGTINAQVPTLGNIPIDDNDAILDWSKDGSPFWVYVEYDKTATTPCQIKQASVVPENTTSKGYIKLAYVDGKVIQNYLNGSFSCQLCNKRIYLWT